MKNIFFTSDTHYGHKNIVRGCTNWEGDLDRCRDFDTLQEHNEALINNINNVVKNDDTLYHLGDWSFGGFSNILEFKRRIKCKEVHLICGNHDTSIENNRDGIQGAFSSVQHYKEVKVDKHHFILSHYAMRVWSKSHHGSIMLYGHSHGTLDERKPEFTCPTWIGDDYFIKNYKTMDVGVDTNMLYPYHIDEILMIMQNKEVVLEIDHHTKLTN